MLSALGSTFNLSPWTLVIPAITMILIGMRVPTLKVLLIASAMGAAGIFIFQSHEGMDIAALATSLWSGAALSNGKSGSRQSRDHRRNPRHDAYGLSGVKRHAFRVGHDRVGNAHQTHRRVHKPSAPPHEHRQRHRHQRTCDELLHGRPISIAHHHRATCIARSTAATVLSHACSAARWRIRFRSPRC